MPSALSAAGPATSDAPAKPNIVLIFTDDQGYADLSAQGQVPDVRTPHLDRLAREGARMTAGYITAPQCSPSRAALLTGRYAQRFGLEHIGDCPLPLAEVTIAERLPAAGYVSGMVGKWHLAPNVASRRWIEANLPEEERRPGAPVRIPEAADLAYSPAAQGFDEYFCGTMLRYRANYDLQGNSLARDGEWITDHRFRVDVQTEAALAFIKRNHERPFFLYLAYFAPHVPLQATPEYLDRFPGPMPERRRHALAMLSAMDDGVGRIVAGLREYGLDEKTMIVFLSDNGAPLKLHKADAVPVGSITGDWDGSLNDPWLGEKGMLTEGGIRVPFIVHWKEAIPPGTVYEHPVSALDIAATAISAAGLPSDERLDGVDLVPFLTGRKPGLPHERLFWRFWGQAAVREGRWKYLYAGPSGRYLFDLETDACEKVNLIATHPEIAGRLARRLDEWAAELDPPGLPRHPLNAQEVIWYEHYLKLSRLPLRK